jgi:cytochrome c553
MQMPIKVTKAIVVVGLTILFVINSYTGESAIDFQADREAGKRKSVTCASCHGADGVSILPNVPNLKGQKPSYIVKQLRDFKSGARSDRQMSEVVKSLNDQDINNLAVYFQSLGN